MREITFRGKRKSTDEWLYGFLLRHGDRVYILTHDNLKDGINAWDDLEVHLPEVIPETVGQDTGLRVMHDRPDGDTEVTFIYEGDIIEERRTRLHDVLCRQPNRYLVCWDGTSFCFKDLTNDCVTPFDDNEYGMSIDGYKVIGNIYDNPNCGWTLKGVNK